MNKKTEYGLLLLCAFSLFVSPARSWADEKKPSVMDKGMSSLETYFSIAGSRQFQPLTQRERAVQFRRELLNAFTFVKVVGSAGLDQWAGKQVEWGQGGAGYGKRVANIAGQYAVQKTTMYALSAALRQDDRYFASGKHGIWARTGDAIASSVLARRNDGTRTLSIPRIGGVAAGAYAARLWLPPSESSAKDGTVSFGISLAGNAGMCVVKEFLPDLFRRIRHK